MKNLKKKERLINRFIEYIENVENSEDKKILLKLNKKERMKIKDKN